MTSGVAAARHESVLAMNGRYSTRRMWWAGVALFTLAGPAWALDLPELMGLLAQRRSGEARFSEERFVSGLDRSLVSSGTLSFSAPDSFTRRTLQPRAESMIVEGQKVTLERSGRVRQVNLDAIPEMAAIVTALRGTLTGDAAALRQYFRPTVSGSAAAWSITLAPLENRLLEAVKQLRIDGEQADVRVVEILLGDGDRSVMAIEPLPAGAAGKPRTTPP